MTPEFEEESTISQRLIALIAHFENGVQTRFAEKVGIATGIVGGMLGKKQSKPGLELTGKILQAYPQVNERWLILGEGEMLKSDTPLKNNSVLSGAAPIELHIEPDVSGNLRAPLINYKAAANYLTGYQSQERYEEVDSLSLPKEVIAGKQAYTAFYVTGDSMEPTFVANDIVVCQQLKKDRWLDLRNELLAVVVSRSHGIQLKRVNVRKELRLLRCRSDNPRSIPFDISLDDSDDKESDVLELWTVEWLLTKRTEAATREDAQRIRHVEDEVGDIRYLLETLLDEKEMNRRLRERDRQKDE